MTSIQYILYRAKQKRLLLRIYYLLLLTATGLLCSCEKMFMEEDVESNKISTFEYLWQRVDVMYSHFDVKGVDWQTVHDTTLPLVQQCLSNEELFSVLAAMLNTLNDGHVNLISSFDVSHSTDLYRRMEEEKNIDFDVVQQHYLGYNYHTTAGFLHQPIADSQVVYIRYGSFSNSAATSAANYVFHRYPKAKGIVLDIRQNGGGEVENVWRLLRLFPGKGQLLYTTNIKSGPAHDAFSPLESVYAPAVAEGFTAYNNPICILIDRGSYSAASTFALCAATYDNVTLIGDTTGGGLGLPNGGDLPIGCHYRFSVTKTYDAARNDWENGVPPDVWVHIAPEDAALGKDAVIEKAVEIILNTNP